MKHLCVINTSIYVICSGWLEFRATNSLSNIVDGPSLINNHYAAINSTVRRPTKRLAMVSLIINGSVWPCPEKRDIEWKGPHVVNTLLPSFLFLFSFISLSIAATFTIYTCITHTTSASYFTSLKILLPFVLCYVEYTSHVR